MLFILTYILICLLKANQRVKIDRVAWLASHWKLFFRSYGIVKGMQAKFRPLAIEQGGIFIVPHLL